MELIYDPEGGLNTLCGLMLKAEDGKLALCKRFPHEVLKHNLAERGHKLIGTAMEFTVDADGKPIFYRLRPNRTVNG